MNQRASGLPARIRQAIEAPVGEAEKLLNDLQDADSETRLSILISGWGRALAGALEELAIVVDELRQTSQPATTESSPRPPREAADDVSESTASEEQASQADLEEARDERLDDEVRRSREQTAELRRQTEEARRDLED
jgi:hypothetical protein